jgi:hypothetical protein
VVVKRTVEIAATSRADDLALRALAEIAAITAGENVRIVGGQMVASLMAAFPVPGISPRRTRDADTAITTELAGSGILHDRLIAHGWVATSGNNYVRSVHELTVPGQPAPELSVDLLVPSLDPAALRRRCGLALGDQVVRARHARRGRHDPAAIAD